MTSRGRTLQLKRVYGLEKAPTYFSFLFAPSFTPIPEHPTRTRNASAFKTTTILLLYLDLSIYIFLSGAYSVSVLDLREDVFPFLASLDLREDVFPFLASGVRSIPSIALLGSEVDSSEIADSLDF